MYLRFYALNEKPFNATPDPRFLYMSPAHREALAQLVYAARERKGFVVLTGRVGTGKTTLLHALRQRLSAQAAISLVVNSSLSFDGILEYVLEDFGIAKGVESRSQRLIALKNFLVEREQTGQHTVLMLDEAHNLDAATLEQIRLLSNFETPNNKLLQILPVGQPELRAVLQLPELQQLKQRIELRCQIPPLTRDEAREYIRTRLRVAGARDLGVFSDAAVERITEYSEGIPRVISLVCDHSLLFGYADQKRRIDRQIVNQAIAYLEDDGATPRRRLARVRGAISRGLRRGRAWSLTAVRWCLWGVAAALAGLVAILALRLDAGVLAFAESMRHVVTR
jgi:general secretion pathway protein A